MAERVLRPSASRWRTLALTRLQGRGIGARLARGGLGLMGAAVASAVLAMGLQGFLTRSLGAHAFGDYAYALSVINFLAMIGVLGFEVTALRFVASYRAVEQWALLRGFVRRSMQVTMTITVVVAIVLVIVLVAVPSFSSKAATPVMLVAAVMLAPLVALRILAANLQGLQRSVVAQALLGIVRPLLLAGALAVALFVVGVSSSAVLAMMLNLGITAATALIAWLVLRKAAPADVWSTAPAFETRQWLKVTGPLFLISVSQTLLTSTDTLMLGSMQGTTAAGYYAVASQIASAVAFTITAVNGIVAPMIAELHAQKRHDDLQRMIRLASGGVLLVATPVLLVLLVFGRQILALFGAPFVAGLPAMIILSLGQFSIVAFGSVGFLMTMTGREKEASRIILISAVVNVVLNFVLIPRFGLAGSATATALSLLLRSFMLSLRVRTAVGVSAGAFALFDRSSKTKK